MLNYAIVLLNLLFGGRLKIAEKKIDSVQVNIQRFICCKKKTIYAMIKV